MSEQNQPQDPHRAQKSQLEDLNREEAQELGEKDAENVRGGLLNTSFDSGLKTSFK